MALLASFHLVSHGAAPASRPSLPAGGWPGLRFARALGTDRGSAMTLTPDVRRDALFAVWDDSRALDRFLTQSAVAAHWRERAEETWNVRLKPLAAHGTWDGGNPLGERHGPTSAIAPLAVLTRNRVRAVSVPAVARALPRLNEHLAEAPGLLAAVGLSDGRPTRFASFTLWSDASSVSAFAYATGSPHSDVVARSHEALWSTEQLFARFRPYRSEGTWGSVDPLAAGRPVEPR